MTSKVCKDMNLLGDLEVGPWRSSVSKTTQRRAKAAEAKAAEAKAAEAKTAPVKEEKKKKTEKPKVNLNDLTS